MKALFLCDIKGNIERVYQSCMESFSEFERAVYTKADLLADPAAFADVEVIFST